MAGRILMKEFNALSKEKWVSIELDHNDVFDWNVALIVLNHDSFYHGGYFKAKMKFPKNYPYAPPEFAFLRPIFHPNIYRDGRVCISILHPPGDDAMSGETAAERWSPAQRAESVLLSIISLLDDAEINSPANIEAAVMLRDKRDDFRTRVRKDVEASLKDLPSGFIMPESPFSVAPAPSEKQDDRDLWFDSDEDEFAGSESDLDLRDDEDEDDADVDIETEPDLEEA